MELRVTFDAKAVITAYDRLQRNFPLAAAIALTKAQKLAQQAVVANMGQVFDRPTRFTLGATFLKTARPTHLSAEVGIKTFSVKAKPPTIFLAPQIYGGPRETKRFEDALRRAGILPGDKFTVPGRDVRLNASGNVSRGIYQQVLTALSASRDPHQNRSESRRSRRTQQRNQIFAFGRPGHYVGIGSRRGRGRDQILFWFVRQPVYRRRLDFHGIADRTARTHFRAELDAQLGRRP